MDRRKILRFVFGHSIVLGVPCRPFVVAAYVYPFTGWS